MVTAADARALRRPQTYHYLRCGEDVGGSHRVCLPDAQGPNSTQILQPCDQFVIVNLKQGWKDGRNAFNEERGTNVDISQANISDTAKSRLVVPSSVTLP
jgi:hypothetical protein